MTHLDEPKLLAGRLLATQAHPYLAGALFAMTIVPTYQVPTMAVDRYWRCYVSPAFVARMPVEELAGVWVHEVSHLLRDHHGRGERYARENEEYGPGERLRRNIAADFEINDDVYGHGLARPSGDRSRTRTGPGSRAGEPTTARLNNPQVFHTCASAQLRASHPPSVLLRQSPPARLFPP